MGQIGSVPDGRRICIGKRAHFLRFANFSLATAVPSDACDSLLTIFGENLCSLARVYENTADWSQTIDHAMAIKPCFNGRTQNHLYGENSINVRRRYTTGSKLLDWPCLSNGTDVHKLARISNAWKKRIHF